MAAKKRVWEHLKTTVTDAASNDVFEVLLSDGERSAGRGIWGTQASDGTDHHAASGWLVWNAVRKGATVTVQFAYGSDVAEAVSAAGTYGVTLAAAVGGASFTVSMTPTSSLVPTSQSIYVRLWSMFPVGITLL